MESKKKFSAWYPACPNSCRTQTPTTCLSVEIRSGGFNVEEIDPEAMQQVINFMHGIPIRDALGLDIGNIFKAAKRFMIDGMIEDVSRIALKGTTVENFIEWGKLADLFNIQPFLEMCAEFIIENELEIVEELPPKFSLIVQSTNRRVLKKVKADHEATAANKLAKNKIGREQFSVIFVKTLTGIYKGMEKIFFSLLNVGLLSKKQWRIHDF